MTTYVLVGFKEMPKSATFDPKQEHVVLGGFPSVEKFMEFVMKGGIPAEWPFYAVIERDVRFYVLVSDEFTTDQIEEMSKSFGHDRWKKLRIARGPYDSAEQAYEAMDAMTIGANPDDFAGVRGMYVGSMEDEEADQLARSRTATQ